MSYDYFIVFHLEGVLRRFEYEVSKQTSDRVRESLEDIETGNLIFEAHRPAEQILVNSRFIQLAQFQWRPKEEALDDGANGGNGGAGTPDDLNTVSFYFTGREAPITLTVEDPEEVFDLVLAMETEAFPRCSIVDAEGEEAVLDIRKLVCAEFPLGLTDRGGAQALFEVQEEI